MENILEKIIMGLSATGLLLEVPMYLADAEPKKILYGALASFLVSSGAIATLSQRLDRSREICNYNN